MVFFAVLYVLLCIDSTRQLDQIGSVKVSSALPAYKTTDDMLTEIARGKENQEKNKRTIVVTSDRLLASHMTYFFFFLLKISIDLFEF